MPAKARGIDPDPGAALIHNSDSEWRVELPETGVDSPLRWSSLHNKCRLESTTRSYTVVHKFYTQFSIFFRRIEDPGCIIRIPNPNFFHPGSRIRIKVFWAKQIVSKLS